MSKSASASKSDDVKITYTTVRGRDVQVPTRVCKNGHMVTPDLAETYRNGQGLQFLNGCGICRENNRRRYRMKVGKR